MSKSREWIAKGKFDISVIEQSLEYYKQDVKDSIHYTEEEKTIFLIINVMGHFEALQKENEKLRVALEKIAEMNTSCVAVNNIVMEGQSPTDSIMKAQYIARAALSEAKGSE